MVPVASQSNSRISDVSDGLTSNSNGPQALITSVVARRNEKRGRHKAGGPSEIINTASSAGGVPKLIHTAHRLSPISPTDNLESMKY